MEARTGDRIIIDSNRVGRGRQSGEIVEVIDGSAAGGCYRVRWSDGHESVLYPGTDARVECASSSSAVSPSSEVRHVSIELDLVEDASLCRATATMRSMIGIIVGHGMARRHPADPIVPMIGEELAVARALTDLADKLRIAAQFEIRSEVHKHPHLV